MRPTCSRSAAVLRRWLLEVAGGSLEDEGCQVADGAALSDGEFDELLVRDVRQRDADALGLAQREVLGRVHALILGIQGLTTPQGGDTPLGHLNAVLRCSRVSCGARKS